MCRKSARNKNSEGRRRGAQGPVEATGGYRIPGKATRGEERGDRKDREENSSEANYVRITYRE